MAYIFGFIVIVLIFQYLPPWLHVIIDILAIVLFILSAYVLIKSFKDKELEEYRGLSIAYIVLFAIMIITVLF